MAVQTFQYRFKFSAHGSQARGVRRPPSAIVLLPGMNAGAPPRKVARKARGLKRNRFKPKNVEAQIFVYVRSYAKKSAGFVIPRCDRVTISVRPPACGARMQRRPVPALVHAWSPARAARRRDSRQ